MRGTRLPWILIAVITAGLFWIFSRFAPLEPASVTVYAGLVLTLAGLASLVKPLRFLAMRTRRAGLVVMAAGLVIAGAGLWWPAQHMQVAERRTVLDEIMPQYDFVERHDVRVHASPGRIVEAWKQVTFGELRGCDTLMRVRAMASGHWRYSAAPLARKRILEVFAMPGSGFLPLRDNGREMVLGMAGQPWAQRRRPPVRSAAEFDGFDEPDSVKIAFNLMVEDEGNGWSRVSTETRTLATDDAARRTMACYWRLIYPGTSLIRRVWLDAIRARAEQFR